MVLLIDLLKRESKLSLHPLFDLLIKVLQQKRNTEICFCCLLKSEEKMGQKQHLKKLFSH